MITPSAIRPTSRGLRRGADPEADRDRHLRLGLGRGDQVGQLRRAARRAHRSSRRSRRRRRSRGRRRRSGPAPGRRRRRDQRHQRQPGGGEGLADLLALAERQVGDDRPGGPGLDRAGGERLGAAVGEDHVRRRPSARPGIRSATAAQISSAAATLAPPSSAAVAAAWIVGPSASGSEKGTPSSIRSAPAST